MDSFIFASYSANSVLFTGLWKVRLTSPQMRSITRINSTRERGVRPEGDRARLAGGRYCLDLSPARRALYLCCQAPRSRMELNSAAAFAAIPTSQPIVLSTQSYFAPIPTRTDSYLRTHSHSHPLLPSHPFLLRTMVQRVDRDYLKTSFIRRCDMAKPHIDAITARISP